VKAPVPEMISTFPRGQSLCELLRDAASPNSTLDGDAVLSSKKYKRDIQDLGTNIVEAKLADLKPKSFRYINSNSVLFGLIAEDVCNTVPEAVVYKSNEPEAVRYDVLVALLVKAYQVEKNKLADARKEIAKLYDIIEETTKRLNGQKKKLIEHDELFITLNNNLNTLQNHITSKITRMIDIFGMYDTYINDKLKT
jgi:hypothetical protein